MHELVSDLNEGFLVKDLREDVRQLILCVHVNTRNETRLPEYPDPGESQIDVAHARSGVRACGSAEGYCSGVVYLNNCWTWEDQSCLFNDVT